MSENKDDLKEMPRATIAATPGEGPTPVEARKIEVTEQEKEEFFKSFLSDTPFKKEIPLFGGKAVALFSVMTVKQNDDVFIQIGVDRANGFDVARDNYLNQVGLYRLAASLVWIKDEQGVYIYSAEAVSPEVDEKTTRETTKDTYLGVRVKHFDTWSYAKAAVIMEAFRSFEGKVLTLVSEVNNADFYKAAE
jgi:hypothetical protein